MKFLIFSVLALAAFTRGDRVQGKRGVVSAQQQAYAAPAPASIAYTKLQQPVQKTLLAAAPQPQFYTQSAAAPAAYNFPTQQQLQYQPQAQAVAYAQPTFAKYAAGPAAPAYAAAPAVGKVAAPVYRQPFSLANDVSSFTYSSPVVTYNNLGLLSQVVGKLANPPVQVQAKAAESPAPAVYQTQPVQSAYAAAPEAQAKYALPAYQTAQRLPVAPSPQQYLTQQVPQQSYISASQAQAYQAAQSLSAQTAPQALYSQAPQYYNAQQAKQVNPGVAYAQ